MDGEQLVENYKTREELEQSIKENTVREILNMCLHFNPNYKYYWRWMYVKREYLKDLFPDIEDSLKEEIYPGVPKIREKDCVYLQELEDRYGFNFDKMKEEIIEECRNRINSIKN